MNLSAPTQAVFLVSVIIAIIALLIFFNVIHIAVPSFWIMTIAYVVLLLGNVLKGI